MNGLLQEVTKHFEFLGTLDAPEWHAPESFRGGFVLRYPIHKIEIEYLECQFTVRRGNEELFGTRNHGRYGGNMFTPEHLVLQLPEIVERVQAQLSTGTLLLAAADFNAPLEVLVTCWCSAGALKPLSFVR